MSYTNAIILMIIFYVLAALFIGLAIYFHITLEDGTGCAVPSFLFLAVALVLTVGAIIEFDSCPNCKHKTSSSFCEKCGTKIDKESINKKASFNQLLQWCFSYEKVLYQSNIVPFSSGLIIKLFSKTAFSFTSLF